MTLYSKEHNSLEAAKKLDKNDPIANFRDQFYFPLARNEKPYLYFAGHSLGLCPKQTKSYVEEELDSWAKFGVEGHFEGNHPWLPYHEFLAKPMAAIVGAKESEVVMMNTLTVNLHLMMVSFYKPTKKRFKILIEPNSFPSDKYAVDSQVRFHGFDPEVGVIELKSKTGSAILTWEEIAEQINQHKDELALIMLGQCNYLSGQAFPTEKIVKLGHECGAMVGFNLAHGAGNLVLKLHDWDVDFAVWCSYKYLNSGPGSVAGAFVHERHLGKKDIPRFEGWWGTDKKKRFLMGPHFEPIPTVEAWQLSNPPILSLAAIRSSLDLFTKATMPALRKKGDELTGYLEFLLKERCGDYIEIISPALERGNMLSIRMKKDPRKLVEVFKAEGVIVDFREPDILRMAPAPMYNSYQDAYQLVDVIQGTF